MKPLLSAVAIAIGITSVCAAQPTNARRDTPAAAAAPETPAPAEGTPPPSRTPEDEARRARVYARLGDATITVGDVEDAVAQQSPYQRIRFTREPARLREFARTLVENRLLADEARRRHIDARPTVVEKHKQALVQTLVRRDFDERITPASITDADVQGYYQAHIDEFSRPEMVRASHILVRTEAEAQQILTEARTVDVARFKQLARERSIDRESKLSGGDLRYFTRDGRPLGGQDRPVDAALVQAAFGLRAVGDVVAAPIRVGDAFSVLMLTGRRPPESTPLEVASDGIRRRLWRERRQQAIDDLESTLRRRVGVTTHPELLARIHLEPLDPSALSHSHGEEGSASPSSMAGAASHGPTEMH